jgi:hypothetical protein
MVKLWLILVTLNTSGELNTYQVDSGFPNAAVCHSAAARFTALPSIYSIECKSYEESAK